MLIESIFLGETYRNVKLKYWTGYDELGGGLACLSLPPNHTPTNHPKLSSQHLQLIKLRQLSAALFAYSSRFIAVLGDCSYLTGFTLGCPDRPVTA